LLGDQAVSDYIRGKISDSINNFDKDDWECVQQLNSSISCDLALETNLFFLRLKEYRSGLMAELQAAVGAPKHDASFDAVDLDTLLGLG
jgi:hypothetical protein